MHLQCHWLCLPLIRTGKSVEGHFPIGIPVLQDYKISMSVFPTSICFKEQELLINFVCPVNIYFLHLLEAPKLSCFIQKLSKIRSKLMVPFMMICSFQTLPQCTFHSHSVTVKASLQNP